MKFNVYAKKQGRLIKLYEINRNHSGLYFNDFRNANNPSYLTYHSDGAFWTRMGRTKTVKKRREPLERLKGAYTLSTGIVNIFAPMPTDPKVDDVNLRDGKDIVVEYAGAFSIEIVLSDENIGEAMQARPGSLVFAKDLKPWMIIVFFENLSNTLPVGSFEDPPTYKISFEENVRI